jgi:hypothetical protein
MQTIVDVVPIARMIIVIGDGNGNGGGGNNGGSVDPGLQCCSDAVRIAMMVLRQSPCSKN